MQLFLRLVLHGAAHPASGRERDTAQNCYGELFNVYQRHLPCRSAGVVHRRWCDMQTLFQSYRQLPWSKAGSFDPVVCFHQNIIAGIQAFTNEG